MEVAWSEIILKSLTIRGVYGRRMFETWRKVSACWKRASTSTV